MTEVKTEKDVEVKIETTQGDWEATFPKTEKVSDVINAVIQHFGFAKNGKYELRLEGNTEALKPERTLVSYGIKDHAVLVFSELGNAA